MGHIEEIKQTK